MKLRAWCLVGMLSGCGPPADDTCTSVVCPDRQHCELRSEEGTDEGVGAVAMCVPDPSCEPSEGGDAFACPASMTCENVFFGSQSTKACVPPPGTAPTCPSLGSCPARSFCQIVETPDGETAACVGSP
jgi:hypothetical protein